MIVKRFIVYIQDDEVDSCVLSHSGDCSVSFSLFSSSVLVPDWSGMGTRLNLLVWVSGDESGLELGSSRKLSLSSSSEGELLFDGFCLIAGYSCTSLAPPSECLMFILRASILLSMAVNSCWMSFATPCMCVCMCVCVCVCVCACVHV